MSTSVGGIRIVDMPDLGVVTDDSSVVGEHAGSGRFSMPALRDYFGGTQALHLDAFVASGDSDDTAALNRMIVAWHALPGGGAMLFPTTRETNLSSPVVINVAQGQALLLGAESNGDARLRFAASFSGTGFTITEGTSTSASEGPLVRIQNLTFISSWADVSGKGFAISCAPAGNVAPGPSCYIEEIRFQNDGGGSWQQGCSLFGMNVTRIRAFTCFGFAGNSVGISYDTDTRISVDHDIEDFFMLGGGTGILLGHAGATGPLQGFTIRRPSFTGCINGVVATCTNNLDEVIITHGQINCGGIGISLTNITTPIISNNYFLDCGTAIRATGGWRNVISNNVFYIGPPSTLPGDGTNNLAIVLDGLSGSPDAGTVVSGNLFTNVYNSIACVQIINGTNYVHCTGNMALQGTVIGDTTGNPNNTDFGNYAGGGINAIYMGSGTSATKPSITVASGNLVLKPASGTNVIVNSPLAIESSDGSTSTFMRTEAGGSLLVNTADLKLSPRVGQPDVPQLAFNYNTTGTTNPALGYNPFVKDFVFYSENGNAVMTIDVNGGVSALGSFVVGNAGPTITSGAGVPAATQPSGSIYLRTSGASGARLYVTSGGGSWTAVAAV